jgi:protein-S-isoprenylcysteine O-methyltransferase Ste14
MTRLDVTTAWVIMGCWVVFFVFWLVSALRVKAVAERVSGLPALAYRAPIVLGTALWCGVGFHDYWRLALTPRTDLARAGGAVICALGLLVAIWSRRTLAGNWSSSVTLKEGHELIEKGPYRFARHPIYTGILLMCLGTAIAQGHLCAWLGFLLMCVGFWIKLMQEESLLLRHFPEAYPAYRKRVKALVPFVI